MLRGAVNRLPGVAKRAASNAPAQPPVVDVLAHVKPGQDLMQAYMQLVKSGRLMNDPLQVKGVRHLQDLQNRIRGYSLPPPPPPQPVVEAQQAASGGWLGRLWGSRKDEPVVEAAPPEVVATVTGPRGLYMWGGPGCGKTLLMDLFYHTSSFPKKKRVHYHSFVLDLHRRNHELRQTTKEPLTGLAESLLSECGLLCLDELAVTDVADAMLIRRLFDILLNRGLVLVATSNRKPDDLYFNGLQRLSFVPFIDDVKRRCDVISLSETDYRLETTAAQTYITPLGADTSRTVAAMFAHLTSGETSRSLKLDIPGQGRQVEAPKACPESGVAWFTFAELCTRPLAAADYFALADNFTTVFVTDVPRLNQYDLNEVRRFITLLDVLYERKVRTIFTAQEVPEKLFAMREVPGDVAFACDRAISRLVEMQSREFLLSTRTAHFRRQPPHQFLARYTGRVLSQAEAEAVWNKYDLDLSGYLDLDELKLLVGDLRAGASGSPSTLPVPAALVASMVRFFGAKTKDRVTRGEFISHLKKNALRLPA